MPDHSASSDVSLDATPARRFGDAATEWREKSARLGQVLEAADLTAVALKARHGFAWATGGCDNHIYNASAEGVAWLVAFADGRRFCLCDSIEAPRFDTEELTGRGIDIVSYPWHDLSAARRTWQEVLGGETLAADAAVPAVPGVEAAPLPAPVEALRLQMTDAELDRYREAGRRAGAAIEAAARRLEPGQTEHEAAGILDLEIRRRGLLPTLALVAADDRLRQFRHPIPTDHCIERSAMLVSCASFGGLITNITRIVHFGPLPDDLIRRHEACCRVDARINTATRPGRTLGEMFNVLQDAYAAEGYADEWQHHHQGGSTGYQGREAFARADEPTPVLDRQVFAWNPSIAGTKSEDTVLPGEQPEVLTTGPGDWPVVEVEGIRRPAILEQPA